MSSQYHFVRFSKFLSLVLRHQPEKIGLHLDPQGWAQVEELIACANAAGVPLSLVLLRRVVAENDKQRFQLSTDEMRIRASQGHSIPVDLGLAPVNPPPRLYHGTAARFLPAIRAQGLLPGRRTHVHLSPDEETAMKVGRRHGTPVVLVVNAGEMSRAGCLFYLSANGVWLAENIPPEYLVFPE